MAQIRMHRAWACVALAVLAAPALADKKLPASRDEIEADLSLEAALTTPQRTRPGEMVQLSAVIRSRASGRAHRVIRPGNGCLFGIVEPHIYYSARFRGPTDERWQDVPARKYAGMCGMGDYRWQRHVTELPAGGALDLTSRLSAASNWIDFSKPGRYEVRLHYAWKRHGTTEKLPQADPVGDLGPMKDVPGFELVSDALPVTVVRPIEVVVEVKSRLEKGVARRLSDLVTVRLENWTKQDLEIVAKRIKVFVKLRPAKDAPRVRRKPLTVAGAFAKKTVRPKDSIVLVGPGGIYDEAWVSDGDGGTDVDITIGGAVLGGPRVRAATAHLRGK